MSVGHIEEAKANSDAKLSISTVPNPSKSRKHIERQRADSRFMAWKRYINDKF